MDVLKSKKRKIVINDRIFYWYVAPDDDNEDIMTLFIVSNDKKFIVSYPLQNSEIFTRKNLFITVKGKEFKGLDNIGNCDERFLVPEWTHQQIITPSFVAQIIDWCFIVEKVTPVDYKGNILSAD